MSQQVIEESGGSNMASEVPFSAESALAQFGSMTGTVEVQSEPAEHSWRVSTPRGSLAVSSPTLGGALEFTATEVLLGALGACASETVLAVARMRGIDVRGVRTLVTDRVEQDPVRVGGIDLQMIIDGNVSEDDLASLEEIAHKKCKIGNTLKRGVDIEIAVRSSEAPAEDSAPAGVCQLNSESDTECAC